MAPLAHFNQTIASTLTNTSTMVLRATLDHTRNTSTSSGITTAAVPWTNSIYSNTVNCTEIQGMSGAPHWSPQPNPTAPCTQTPTPQFITTTIRSFAYLSIVIAIMLVIAYTLTILHEENDETDNCELRRPRKGRGKSAAEKEPDRKRTRSGPGLGKQKSAWKAGNEVAWKLVVTAPEDSERQILWGERRVDEETLLLRRRDRVEQWRQIEMQGEARSLMKKNSYMAINYVVG